MKCPNCGYFNLPGANVCGQCRRALDGTSTPAKPEAVPIADIIPPRAKNRSLAMNIEAHSPTTRAAKRFAESDWERTKTHAQNSWLDVRLGWFNFKQSVLWWFNADNWRDVWRWNAAPAFSIFPGAGQFLQRRYFMAGVLALLGIILFIGVVWAVSRQWTLQVNGLVGFIAPLIALPYLLWLNGIVIGFCVVVWFSVWDAAKHSYPHAGNDAYANRLRNFRLVFGSILYTSAMLALFFQLLNTFLPLS